MLEFGWSQFLLILFQAGSRSAVGTLRPLSVECGHHEIQWVRYSKKSTHVTMFLETVKCHQDVPKIETCWPVDTTCSILINVRWFADVSSINTSKNLLHDACFPWRNKLLEFDWTHFVWLLIGFVLVIVRWLESKYLSLVICTFEIDQRTRIQKPSPGHTMFLWWKTLLEFGWTQIRLLIGYPRVTTCWFEFNDFRCCYDSYVCSLVFSLAGLNSSIFISYWFVRLSSSNSSEQKTFSRFLQDLASDSLLICFCLAPRWSPIGFHQSQSADVQSQKTKTRAQSPSSRSWGLTKTMPPLRSTCCLQHSTFASEWWTFQTCATLMMTTVYTKNWPGDSPSLSETGELQCIEHIRNNSENRWKPMNTEWELMRNLLTWQTSSTKHGFCTNI